MSGASFLIDPVFSKRIARDIPDTARRACDPCDLPPFDALLVTHNHYDHLDEPSVLRLRAISPSSLPRGSARGSADAASPM